MSEIVRFVLDSRPARKFVVALVYMLLTPFLTVGTVAKCELPDKDFLSAG